MRQCSRAFLAAALLMTSFSSLAVAQVPGTIFTANPAALSSCEAPREVSLSWDARASKAADVEVLAAPSATGESQLFAAVSGAVGTAKTGPWTRAGSLFTLRDQKTKAVLATLTIGSLPCTR
ncbi:hypothetical protein [Aquabacter sediminis]|uniref:hypothetical protein n=1 Tax=Aquabacter sediminis TaxID=3029197 RepID=UPI00237E7F38|nr:hypothetical protein [Aquabacter sp. P-9]MDE1570962.1 hypothetical protein [Aquabacter sp. P-9]